MILGTHELVGTLETLKQPFCVLRKTTDSNATSSKTLADSDGHGVSYHVQGVVTRKLLFHKYPKVIMRTTSIAAQ
jgi:hypothetical protein